MNSFAVSNAANRFSAIFRLANALSMDAVFVAVVWQAIFCLSFTNRLPSVAQSAALGLTVWLIYVADRLLDAARLDETKLVTFRHRFHRLHRQRLAWAWIAVLVVDACVVYLQIDPSVQSLGMVLAVAVLVYGASVHFAVTPQKILPKEVQIGALFAAGVSLIVWREAISVELMVTMLLSAILFTCNCIVVAIGEKQIDQAQSFDSMPLRFDGTEKLLIATMLALAVVSVALGLTDGIPVLVAWSLSFCCLVLLLVFRMQRRFHRVSSDTWAGGLIADLTLAIPPLFCWPMV